ncbi:site-specific integrase [Carnobacterium divergens]|uniref:tyrosine-type recombinase/integrase n=1 Tax=Carnobacterium divergens TaxID=2748 RepID=UPI0010729123|nr:site-specific integrase [Carnobacterium divergens]TFI65714.1 site-specific integrase [Carnobacterium divergens]TFI65819.1 site-specific integrase [Carnobacterium divergens]TFI80669.1 site-specific integrase [Carnobacterium divergens]TFJ06619.1 site-specific integrase [Carnobacterium divergens]TFJ12020.1 site-specific integrase [Carnobacterium divergens]
MAKTKYPCVYQDSKGRFSYLVELGIDQVTGKRIQKKGTKDQLGKRFSSARETHKEVTRIKSEYLMRNGFANYDLTYKEFMEQSYMPHYKASVQRSTWNSRECGLEQITEQFSDKKLREINVRDCEKYRIWLLNMSGYSQAYCSLIYGMFRKTLDYAVTLQYLTENISKRTKAIAKGKSIVPYWTKEEFEKVLSVIYKNDFYEHMCFVMIWLYYMTGIRVSEGLALNWNDVDLKKKKLRVHHTLDMKNQDDFIRKPYTKTESGMRVISLDEDTVLILKEWKKVQSSHSIEQFILSYTDLPLYRSTVQRIIERYAKSAKVPAIQGKGLRHSHVSYLINEFNADILVVSQRLGHSSPEITLKHYAHLWSRNDESIAEQMTGNIEFTFATESKVAIFNGNQAVKI